MLRPGGVSSDLTGLAAAFGLNTVPQWFFPMSAYSTLGLPEPLQIPVFLSSVIRTVSVALSAVAAVVVAAAVVADAVAAAAVAGAEVMNSQTDRVGLGWRSELAAGIFDHLDQIDRDFREKQIEWGAQGLALSPLRELVVRGLIVSERHSSATVVKKLGCHQIVTKNSRKTNKKGANLRNRNYRYLAAGKGL
jgi:hypothetical protein